MQKCVSLTDVHGHRDVSGTEIGKLPVPYVHNRKGTRASVLVAIAQQSMRAIAHARRGKDADGHFGTAGVVWWWCRLSAGAVPPGAYFQTSRWYLFKWPRPCPRGLPD